MAADSGGHQQVIYLEPFIHQVGGHSSMLLLDDLTICKPAIPQELNFYSTIPEKLKPFTSEYKGVTDVNFIVDSNGYLILSAKLPEEFQMHINKCHKTSQQKNTDGEDLIKYKIRIQSGGIEIESSESGKILFEKGNGSKETNLNPWVLHCHQEQLLKLRTTTNTSQKFILLENLTSKYNFPCVLDLKMGTRQYGDDASLSKRQSHQAKVAATTSGSLGVRISGMQVYHVDSGRFICHDKYYGRSLTVEGFKQALFNFLHNGEKLRLDILPPLINLLRQLSVVIKELDTFRFFTSSLLIIYDGAEKPSVPIAICNGNSVFNSDKQMFNFTDNANINKVDSTGKEKASLLNAKLENRNSVDGKPGQYKCPSSISNTVTDQAGSSNSQSCLVDIRMVDFAHSTHSHLVGVQNSHSGPDDGYIFGLENLIAKFKSIQQEYG